MNRSYTEQMEAQQRILLNQSRLSNSQRGSTHEFENSLTQSQQSNR